MTEASTSLIASGITSVAVIVSALIGAGVAIHSIREQRAITRRRATLDLLAQREWDTRGIEKRDEFIRLRDGEGGLEAWADPCHRESTQQATIAHVLNEYELIAVGIREGILDEDLYRRWFQTSLIHDWHRSENFIRHIRAESESNAIYAEFEYLAQKWHSERKETIVREAEDVDYPVSIIPPNLRRRY